MDGVEKCCWHAPCLWDITGGTCSCQGAPLQVPVLFHCKTYPTLPQVANTLLRQTRVKLIPFQVLKVRIMQIQQLACASLPGTHHFKSLQGAATLRSLVSQAAGCITQRQDLACALCCNVIYVHVAVGC